MLSIEIIEKIIFRGSKYGLVGFLTYLLDLSLVLLMINYFKLDMTFALGLSFLIAVSLNFFISYHLVFNGTSQTISRGYLYFISLAIFGAVIITFGTTYLIQIFALPLLLARTFMATIVGSINFLINALYNFKLL